MNTRCLDPAEAGEQFDYDKANDIAYVVSLMLDRTVVHFRRLSET